MGLDPKILGAQHSSSRGSSMLQTWADQVAQPGGSIPLDLDDQSIIYPQHAMNWLATS